MPDPGTLLLFMLAAVVLVAIPGPNHLYIVTRSIAQGRRAGLASAVGVESGTLVHIAAAAAGISALVASSALAFNVVKYLGAAYLVYLGIRALLARDAHAPEAHDEGASLRRAYVDGLLVNVLNPKVALFFLAFVPQFVDTTRPAAPQVVVLGLLLSAIGLASNVLYAVSAGALGAWLRERPGFWRRRRYVTGGAYVGLGVVAALAGGRRQG